MMNTNGVPDDEHKWCTGWWTQMVYRMMNTNGVPDDEHMMFEACRRHEELN